MTEESDFRPGLEGVVAGETAISTIAGGLQYRGYTIEELAEHATFEEVAYLLLRSELPTAEQLEEFQGRLRRGSAVPVEVVDLLRHIPDTAPMMDVMRSATSLLAHWDPDAGDDSPEAEIHKAERLIAQLPVVLAARFRLMQGKEPIAADPKRSLADNTLRMLFRRDKPSAARVAALDLTLILYAEHEYNASTFTSRIVTSTQSDLHSAITAAIGALKGPLHGGANERVMEILEQVGGPQHAEQWVRDALARKVRVMGFGHRVYKQGDPRATYLKARCQELAVETNNQALEETAEKMEQVIAEEKGLRPNLDWPSARLYHYLGLPVPLYTPLFVISRVVGWSAHVIEQRANNRLIRPRARYTGPANRRWVPLGQR